MFQTERILKTTLAIAGAILALAGPPAFAKGHSHYHSAVSHHSAGSSAGFAPSSGDEDRDSDYARAAGSPDDPTLSTGWTSGHGSRTEHVHDYYRHTKSGGMVHVHSYYRRHR